MSTLAHRIAPLATALSLLLSLVAAPAEALPERDPPENPFVTYEHPQDWTMRVNLRVRAWQETRSNTIRTDNWEFATVAVIYPLMTDTASARLDPETVAGTLKFDDRTVASSFTAIDGYHSNQRYAKFEAVGVYGREMQLEVEALTRAWRTQFDEAAASRVVWPEGPLPPDAQATLAPQPFVETAPGGLGDPSDVDKLLLTWTNGNHPRSVPPLQLAKWVAGRVVEHVQPQSDGLNRGRRFLGFEGFQLQGAPQTARSGRGSPFDAAALLAAVYRQAGLPARIVIAYREVDDDDPDDDERGAGRLRAYVEFYLHDEANNRGGWIPVDVVAMRESSSRAPTDLSKPWRYFGTHDELDLYIPLSFNFHPPTTVRAYGSPAMWGWFVTPTPPSIAYQYLSFTAFRTPQRASGPVLPGER
ncbi:MAG: transglutaminase-like domain-containing protein [Planctomycetota bacterium]